MKNVVLLIFVLSMQTVHGGAMLLGGERRRIEQGIPLGYYYYPIASPSTTSLHESARYGFRLGIYCNVYCCCRGKTSFNKIDGYGETPLMAAAKHGHLKTAELLIRYGGSVHKTHRDRSPLWHALEYSHLNIAALLIDHGARIPFDCINQSNLQAMRDLCNERNKEIESVLSSSLPEDCATLIGECLAIESLLKDRNDNDLLAALQEEAQKRQQLTLDDFDKSYL